VTSYDSPPQYSRSAPPKHSKKKIENKSISNVTYKLSSIVTEDVLPSNGKKGKSVPLEAWTGPEGARGLRFPDFKTIGTGWW